jgi:hypothetical protein
VSPLEKQRNGQHDIWCLITNTWANRVVIGSSVITKIFNPCKYWTVTTQPSVTCSVFIHFHCKFSFTVPQLFDFSFVSVFIYTHFILLFIYSVYFLS